MIEASIVVRNRDSLQTLELQTLDTGFSFT